MFRCVACLVRSSELTQFALVLWFRLVRHFLIFHFCYVYIATLFVRLCSVECLGHYRCTAYLRTVVKMVDLYSTVVEVDDLPCTLPNGQRNVIQAIDPPCDA